MKLNISQELLKFYSRYGTAVFVFSGATKSILCENDLFQSTLAYDVTLETFYDEYKRSIDSKTKMIVKVFYQYAESSHTIIHWNLIEGLELKHHIANVHVPSIHDDTKTIKLIYDFQEIEINSVNISKVQSAFKLLLPELKTL